MRRLPVHWGLSILLFPLYCAISVPRHLTMHSGLDLGIFDQAVRGYAYLRAPVSELKGPGANLLGDHFHPILVLLAPFYRLFPSPVTLLVAQAALFALSAAPVTRLAIDRLGRTAGLYVGVAYGLSWGVQQAVFFDFHELAFAMPLLAFSMEMLARQRYRAAIGWAAPLLLVKEDQAALVAAIGVYILWQGRGRLDRIYGAITAAGGVAAGLVIVLVVIPWFNARHQYTYFDMASHPAADPLTRLLLPWWKLATVAAILATVLFLALRSPLATIVLAVLVPRFWLTNPNLWGMHFHYTATQMPILFVAFIDAVCRLRASPGARLRRLARAAPATALAVALVFSVAGQPVSYLARPSHWLVSQRTRTALAMLRQVPDGASVSARDPFLPWLTGRCHVYRFPEYPTPQLRPLWLVVDEADRPPVDGYALVDRAVGVRVYRFAGYATEHDVGG